MRHVDTDLVRSAGLKLDSDQGVSGKPFQDSEVGDGQLTATIDAEFFAICGMSSDGLVYGAAGYYRALYQRHILSVYGSHLQLIYQ